MSTTPFLTRVFLLLFLPGLPVLGADVPALTVSNRVTYTSAVMTITANPNGAATLVYVEYGTTPGYGNLSQPTVVPTGEVPVWLAFSLPALSYDTLYFARVVGSNSLGITTLDATFRTPSPRPGVAQLRGVDIGTRHITLDSVLGFNGYPGSYWLEWGATSYSESTLPVAAAEDFGFVFLTATNLVPFSPYRFRVAASNEAGIVYEELLLRTAALGYLQPLADVLYSAGGWADYDNDADLDLLLTGRDGTNQSTFLYRNDGVQFALDPKPGLEGFQQSSVTWADFDNDGKLDLLLTGYSGRNFTIPALYRNMGHGSFDRLEVNMDVPFDSVAAPGDLDQDGDVDLLVLVSGFSGMSRVYRNEGHFRFTEALLPIQIASIATVAPPALGDIDGDGDLDFVFSRHTGTWWVENGGDYFTNLVIHPVTDFAGSVTLGDYDSDGDLDLAVVGLRGGYKGGGLFRNNGVGVFGAVQTNFTGFLAGTVVWGDLDNDGDLDLVMTEDSSHYTQRGAIVYRNEGMAGFNPIFSGLEYWNFAHEGLALGDMDADGDLDVAITRGPWFGQRSVYVNEITNVNTRPAAPGGLDAVVAAGEVTLSWGSGSDAETPASGLTYNVRVGTGANNQLALSAHANADGRRTVVGAGNAGQRRTLALKGLVPGSYCWRVQTVDNSFVGSPFSTEHRFEVPGGRPLRISRCAREANGVHRIELEGEAGQQYLFEASGDLRNWVPIGTPAEARPGEFEIVDTASLETRFYRATMP